MPNIGAPELIIILVIALLILGPGKLPEVGASIGKSLREFRKASSDVQDATKLDVSPTPPATTPAATTAADAATPAPVAPDAEAVAAAKATIAAAEAVGAANPDAPSATPSTSESTAASH
jgi:TatA/E family protein of Tat protein translocase